ncbi:MAG: ATP-binding cassette domain-containing protein [Nitriliruptorales bacterium]|nr:ATP-binding cassette domain-containing protein [Nitriliruptorales bacterium]
MRPLELRDLSAGYSSGRRRTVVVRDLTLSIAPGEFVCLVGPNGSGKSTLLRTIAGMQPALAGKALLGGSDVAALAPAERARRLAVVLTDPLDIGAMTARDLVSLGRYPHTDWAGRLKESDRASVTWAMAATGASTFADRPVAELSDGERQRVLLARALAQQPTLLGLDEAVAFIDVPRRVELVQILRNLARECGLAVLLTTHDLDLALRHADTLWLLEPGGDGTRVHAGGPEDLVLAGVVARAFAGDEVTFDMQRGVFVPVPAMLAGVAVSGDGLAAVWTRRAMEREGLAVEESAPVTVEVGDGAWTIRTPGGSSIATTISETVAQVRAALPDLADSPVKQPR